LPSAARSLDACQGPKRFVGGAIRLSGGARRYLRKRPFATPRTAVGLDPVANDVHMSEPAAMMVFVSGSPGPSVTPSSVMRRCRRRRARLALVRVCARRERKGERICLTYAEVLDRQAALAHV
jgi:hypothetical protein